MSEKLDIVTAWMFLERFAAVAGVELDCRAHPDYDEDEDDTDEEKAKAAKLDDDGEEVGENEVSNYDTLLRAIQSNHVMISESGALTLKWITPPIKDFVCMTLDPVGADDGQGWPYSQAFRALNMVPIAPPVSKRARKRSTTQMDDQMERLDRFIEVLSGAPRGSILKIRHMHDRDVVTALAKFILLESRRSH